MAKFVWNHDKTLKVNIHKAELINIERDKLTDCFSVKVFFREETSATLRKDLMQTEAQAFIDSITKSPEEEVFELLPKIVSTISGLTSFSGSSGPLDELFRMAHGGPCVGRPVWLAETITGVYVASASGGDFASLKETNDPNSAMQWANAESCQAFCDSHTKYFGKENYRPVRVVLEKE